MRRLFASHWIGDVAVETKTVFVTYEFLKLLLGGHVARLHDMGVTRAATRTAGGLRWLVRIAMVVS